MRKQQCDLIPFFLAGDAHFVGKHGFPQLLETHVLPSDAILPFNYLLTCGSVQNFWFHFFIDDYQFNRIWNNFDKYLKLLLFCQGCITTDFSLYRDDDTDNLIWNCLRNRTIAYALQKNGIPIIPTAGFAGESSWEWCFDGLPSNSTLALTNNGGRKDKEAQRLFVGGLETLVNLKRPRALVFCGSYPKWINSKYPEITIVQIPSYSQQWKQRRCN